MIALLQRLVVGVARTVASLMVSTYFRRVEVFHAERVPAEGPLLVASNHPASVTDALLLATQLRRPVSFVGTVQLFRSPILAWLLRHVGIIPVNRLKDDPRAMRSVLDTFEACFKVLERGEALGIFPEGVTYDDEQLRPLKSGVARMALDLEHRHGGRLGLRILPVGLTYAAKERYRSEVLVQFGEPLEVAGFLPTEETGRKAAIQALLAEVEQRLKALVVHLTERELAIVVQRVGQLYLERLRLGNRIVREPLAPQAEALALTRAIAQGAAYLREHDRPRYDRFTRDLSAYDRRLRRLHLTDDLVGAFGSGPRVGLRLGAGATLAVFGLLPAVYGLAHRALPAWIVAWAVRRHTAADRRKAQTAITSMVAGLAAFTLAYGVYVGLVHVWLGWPVSLYYALSLPLTGLFGLFYWRQARRLKETLRAGVLFLRAPTARRRLLRQREALIRQIEAGRAVFAATLPEAPFPTGPKAAST